MEKMSLNTTSLKNTLDRFENRQVVLNFYQKDMLVDRVGLFFDTIKVSKDSVHFQKNGDDKYVLDIHTYDNFHTLMGFKHYYSLSTGDNRVELYFP